VDDDMIFHDLPLFLVAKNLRENISGWKWLI
jgi:hypothetical protein